MGFTWRIVLTGLLAAFVAVAFSNARSAERTMQYHWSGGDYLTWTAPGDDGNVGIATAYDLRYSKTKISSANIDSATKFENVPEPLEAGSTQTCFVSGLEPGRVYYFAIKTVDDAGNWSAMSNLREKKVQSYIVGDVDRDSAISISDISYLANYVMGQGKEPLPWGAGDTNCDGGIDISDLIYLINYVYYSGSEPGADCP